MSVISIVGAPGVGKSFLAKQLACLHASPAFFEGEADIFTKDVLAILNNEQDSKERFIWITSQYQHNLEKAHQIAAQGIDCYVDGDILSFEAWLDAEQGKHSPNILKQFLKDNEHLQADKVIVLVKTKKELLKTLKARGRKSEQTSFIFDRALRVQKGCMKLAEKYEHAILIDRTNIDYTDEDELKKIVRTIQAMPSRQQA